MLIYFDESYDNEKKWLILGATFHTHSKFLHKKMREIKVAHNFVKHDGTLLELKFSKCLNKQAFSVAKECVDAFFESTSFFRCIAIETGAQWFDLNHFGQNDDKKIKNARLYKKFTEMLINHNTKNVFHATLLFDELSRCDGDAFIPLMTELFLTPGKHFSCGKTEPTIHDLREVRSDLEEYQVLQITDLFIGAVLRQIMGVGTNTFKNDISSYISSKVGKSLTKNDWEGYTPEYAEENSPKFNIWFWEPKPPKT